jgi:hypothetical protein
MPNATTLGTSQRTAILKNTGAFSLAIQDFAGNPLCTIDPSDVIILFCTAIGTTAGTWTSDSYLKNGISSSQLTSYVSTTFDVEMYSGIILRVSTGLQNYSGNYSKFEFLRDDHGELTVVSEYVPTTGMPQAVSSEYFIGACKVDTNRFVVFWINNSYYINACCYEINPTNFAIREGEPYNLSLLVTGTNNKFLLNGSFRAISHDTNRITLAYWSGSATITVARGTTAIGTTLAMPSSYNTSNITGSATGNIFNLVKQDTNKAILAFCTSNQTMNFKGLNLSTGISEGTNVQASNTATTAGIATFSTTKSAFFGVTTTTAPNTMCFGVITFSGTNTLTLSNQSYITLATSNNYAPNLVPFGEPNTEFLATYNNGRNVYYSKATISADVPTFSSWALLGNTPVRFSGFLLDTTFLTELSGRRASIRFGQMDDSARYSGVVGILNESVMV